MAAPTIQQIMEAIETSLETIPGLRTSEYVPDQISTPQAVVDFPGEIAYHGTFAHGKYVFEPTVTILVSRTVDRIGTAALAAYASPSGSNSIHLAIEADDNIAQQDARGRRRTSILYVHDQQAGLLLAPGALRLA